MSTVLTTFLTEIANAIRGKTGGTAEINAQNFATEIENIEVGANVTVTENPDGTVDLEIS